MAVKKDIFVSPKPMPSLNDSIFYHTIDLPGYGTFNGQWDLRGRLDDYFGYVDMARKRVLDIGTATGFLAFEAERRGAEVVAFDLSDEEPWDHVPYNPELTVKAFGRSSETLMSERKNIIGKMHNGFWFSHHALKSGAKVCYGNAYRIPRDIGDVDVSIFGSILLHMRNPLTALESAAKLTRETVIVAEPIFHELHNYNDELPSMLLIPSVKEPLILDTWWQHTPALISTFLQILGFTRTFVNYHEQVHVAQNNAIVKYFTVVGCRPGVDACVRNPDRKGAVTRFDQTYSQQPEIARLKAIENSLSWRITRRILDLYDKLLRR